jgi:hypothetical protein
VRAEDAATRAVPPVIPSGSGTPISGDDVEAKHIVSELIDSGQVPPPESVSSSRRGSNQGADA